MTDGIADADRSSYGGQRIRPVEDQTLLRGRGSFMDDLPIARGTPDDAFAAADRQTEITIRHLRNSITPMET